MTFTPNSTGAPDFTKGYYGGSAEHGAPKGGHRHP
jgi:hypothetical protein